MRPVKPADAEMCDADLQCRHGHSLAPRSALARRVALFSGTTVSTVPAREPASNLQASARKQSAAIALLASPSAGDSCGVDFRCAATKYVDTMGSAAQARVKLTNADKVLYPATGTTKADIFDYYTRIAEVMLPHIAGRPATRKRWPNGVEQASFFEKQLASSAPDWLPRASVDPPVRNDDVSDHRQPRRRWPGLRSRRRWRCTCRSGGSSPSGPEAGPKSSSPARQRDWCSTWTRAKA